MRRQLPEEFPLGAKSDSRPAASAAAESRPGADRQRRLAGARCAFGAGGGGRSARGAERGRGGGGFGGVGREKAAGKGSTPVQGLECDADGPLLQVFSFTEDFRWQDNAVDLRGKAEPRPPRGLPRNLPRQLETGGVLHQGDVRAEGRRGLRDLQAEILGGDHTHPHHRTGGQEGEGEEESRGRLLQLPES